MAKKSSHHDVDHFRQRFQTQEAHLLDEYFAFLRFPTISADPAKRANLKACAQWLELLLSDAGLQVELWNREGAPIVFASYMEAGPDKPTLLLYNHYDVQPTDPIEEWESDPFIPRKKGPIVYARGAQDNKGQCFYVLASLISYLKHEGPFPINIKLLIEGEEESASHALSSALVTQAAKLKADYAVIVDVGMKNHEIPAITLGTRGLVAATLEVSSTKTDLHSGAHGGLAYNPLHALVELLASARAPNGMITIPGFYDDVVAPSSDVLGRVACDFSPSEYHEAFGAHPTGGEKGFAPHERNWLRPTLEINGIHGGYGGPGSKTVIPAQAIAKLSCRLVPNQRPDAIAARLKHYFEGMAPRGTIVTVKIHEGKGEPVRTRVDSPIVRAIETACEEVFWQKCQYIFDGASIPIVPELATATGADVAMWGVGLPEDHIHAPNESFGWDRMERGFLVISRLIEILG